MRKYPRIFSEVIISIVEVGEQGGTLEKNLNFLAVFPKEKITNF
jgi:type II secretory pathway component PulF